MATQPTHDAVRGVEITIPLSKLKKSPNNARRMPHGDAAIEALAASIAVKGMLQPPVVEPERDAEGAETGCYLVTAGEGRRLALLLRAKRREIRKSDGVRCTLDTQNDPHEISLDENVTRTPMHPADQFEAFKRQADERGFTPEDIGARFGVSGHVVRQRLRLGAVSPRLLDIYREDGLTLEQLMAFAITDDHARQERVFDNLHHNREPWIIRRDLTAANVPGHDPRAVLVGPEAYTEAGGHVIRDLFSEDRGGYFEDAALLDTLALETLRETAQSIIDAEGWKWAETALDFPHGHGFRRFWPQPVELSEDDAARLDTVSTDYDALIAGYDSYDEMSDEIAEQATALDREIDQLRAKQSAFPPADVARGGVIVSLGHDGRPRIERGFIRPEDETPVADAESEGEAGTETAPALNDDQEQEPDSENEEDAEEDRPLSDLLLRDLSAHRTLGLRLALGDRADIALIAVTHALASSAFYAFSGSASALELRTTVTGLGTHADGIEDGPAASLLETRHGKWGAWLPAEVDDLWAFIAALDDSERLALLAHCASLSVNALMLPWDRKPRALANAEVIATATALDMTAHWQPTAERFFGRVTKSHIVAAVREAVSDEAAERLLGMKKVDMAQAAETLVAGTGWLPAALRTKVVAPSAELVAFGPPAPEAFDEVEGVNSFAVAAE